MTKHISIHICFGLLVGIVLSNYLNLSITTSWVLLGTLFFILLVVFFISKKLFNSKFYFALATFLFFIGLGATRLTFTKDNLSYNHYTHFLKQKNVLVLNINQVLKPSKNYQKYKASVLQINQQKTFGNILLNIKKDSLKTSLKVGQFFFTDAAISDLETVKNPFQFDYKRYLENKQIFKQIYTDAYRLIPIKKPLNNIKAIAANIRLNIITNLKAKGLKGDELAVVKALLLGEKNSLNTTLRQNYAAAGAIHILAISGLHIGIIMLLINFLLSPLNYLKHGKLIKLSLVLLILWLYAILAGLSPSILRATTMFSALGFALFLDRKTELINVLALSAIILLLINPFYIFDVGFKMSYLAVISIVLFQPKIAGIWHPKLKILNYFWQLLSVSAAAQLGVLPLSLYYFHQFPGLFFLTNLVVIPLLGVILGLGLILLILAATHLLSTVIATFYQGIIYILNNFIAWVAHQEAFLFKDISFSLSLLITAYLVIIAFYYWHNKPQFKRSLVFCLSLLLFQSVLFYEKYQTANNNEFIVFNNYKNPLIALKTGSNLSLFSKKIPIDNYTLKAYKIAAKINNIKRFKKTINLFNLNGKSILILDKSGVYTPLSQIDILVLTQSPKINLDRLIQQLHPKLVIADASNYYSFINRWQKTCRLIKTPFYNTSKSGAFIYQF